MFYEAYHINIVSLDQFYIGSHIVNINGIPDYARNDDFSLIFANVNIEVVEELDAAYRTVGEYIGFKKDEEFFWYGKIVKSNYNTVNKTYSVEIEHIIPNKFKDLITYTTFGYNGADPAYRHTVSSAPWGMGSIYYFEVMAILDVIQSTVLPTIITAVTYDFSAASLANFNTFYYLNFALSNFDKYTGLSAYEYFSLFCKAFGISVRLSDNTIIFKRLDEILTNSDYNDQVTKTYDLSVYNKYERSERVKQVGKSLSVVISEYYRDLLFYNYTYDGYIQTPITYLAGYYSEDGFYEFFNVTTSVFHGFLKDEYENLRIYSEKTGTPLNDFQNAINEDYEYKRYYKPGNFGIIDSTHLKVYSDDYAEMPRVETTMVYTGCTISEAAGLPLVTLPTTVDYGLNHMMTITISNAGSYNGTYYGINSTNTYEVVDINKFNLKRSYLGPSVNATITIKFRHIIKEAYEDPTDNNYLRLIFYDDPTRWSVGSQDIEVINTEGDYLPDTYTYDGIYSKGSTSGQWNATGGYIRIYVDNVFHELSAAKTYNELDPIKKPDKADGERQVEFPKHFFFFTGYTLAEDSYLGRMTGLFPLGTGNYLKHLNDATIENNSLEYETINIDDTTDITDLIHKEAVYNVGDRSIDIKQMGIL